MPAVAYLNGKIMPIARAKVSVEDRGYQFGDGVYEVMRAYRGRLFRIEAHLKRLARSAEAIQLKLPYAPPRLARIVRETYAASRFPDAKVYVQVTRGVAPRSHEFPARSRPQLVVTVRRLEPLPAAYRNEGVAAITTADLRWDRCDVKSLNLLPNVLARQEARSRGAFEAVLVRDGRVAEGASSNVFAVSGRTLLTPPEGPRLLSGITREFVIEVARRAGIPVRERELSVEDLARADEILLTGTVTEVIPVVRLDGRPVGDGKPGPVGRALMARFREGIEEELRSSPLAF